MPSTISLNTIPLGANGVTNFINNNGLANNTIFAQTLRDIVINTSFPTLFANGSIDSSKLATIPGNKIQTRSLSGSKNLTNGGQIAWYSIDSLDIADQAIESRTIKDDAVGNNKLSDMSANSVKVNNTNSVNNPNDLAIGANSVMGRSGTGNMSSIAAGDDTVLRRNGTGNLSFGKVGENQLEDSVRIPIGGIIMWSGTIASVPTGWGFCDGTTYVFSGRTTNSPDLRDRFIVGARQDSSGEARTNIEGSLRRVGGSNSHSHAIAANALSITTNVTFPNITASSTIPTASVGDIAATASGGAVQSHTLTITQMPTHSHGIDDPGHDHNTRGSGADDGGDFFTYGNNGNSSNTTRTRQTGITILDRGGGQGHTHGFTQPTITVTKPSVTISRPTITASYSNEGSASSSHLAATINGNNIPTYFALAYIIKL